MTHLQTFQVLPAMPEPISFLEKLSRNIWWSWQHDAIEMFRRIEPKLWESAKSNPIAFLSLVPQKRYEELAKDNSFHDHMNRVKKGFESIRATPSNEPESGLSKIQGKIAYFSMEFGIHESLPLYAGGLGMLAGDHLKAASDMALPIIGIGLLYRKGYFYQFLNQDGMQQESYPEHDLFNLPVERAKDQTGNDLYVTITGPEGEIQAVVWKIDVGCVPLYLLDANLAENPAHIRDITANLYAADQNIRLSQEMLLGVGGMRALAAMGVNPSVIHMNEGHCSFACLERLAQIMSIHSVSLKTALEIVPRSTVFTTHTPVAAGHDEFSVDLLKPCVVPFEKKLGVSVDEILSWGQLNGSDSDYPFSMFVLGVRLAQYCNGVSELHGKVARRMWSHVWPKRPEDEAPITHVTNGVHVPTWISYEFTRLFERYLGQDWTLSPWNTDIFKRIEEIYDEDLWRAHEMNRSRLIRTCRELMKKQYQRRNAPKAMMDEVEAVLDPDILTIGFARRFASYKRAYLILMDPERLERIITSETRPVQFIFSGKAHPKDQGGKDLIRQLIRFARRKSIRHRFIFLENYDPHIARHLVQGADVWLNTPRRPFEACGTSGMKAALNGVLNVSILDGWWCEGYSEKTGWRIGNGEEYTDHKYQDAVESQALYNVLENDVMSCFYERNNDDLPSGWIKMMKASMMMAMQRFSSHKMVDDYVRRFYVHAEKRIKGLVDNHAAEATQLSQQLDRFKAHWNEIQAKSPTMETTASLYVGNTIHVTSEIYLGKLAPEEVVVDLYYGPLKNVETLQTSHNEPMAVKHDRGSGNYLYACDFTLNKTGRYGFTARVTPKGDDWVKFTPGLVTWAN